MAKLPRYTAKVPPPRGAGVARATNIGALTRTGAAETWRGVSQIGRAVQQGAGTLFRIQQDRQAADTRLQHGKLTSDIEGYINNLGTSLENATVQSIKQREDMLKSTMSQVDKYRQVARRGYDSADALTLEKGSWGQNRLRYENTIRGKLAGRLDDHQVTTGLDLSNQYIANGNEEEAVKNYKFMLNHNLLTPFQADSLIKQVPIKITKAMREAVDKEAQAILESNGIDDATAYVAKVPTDILPLDEKAKVIEGLKSIADVDEIEVGLEVEANNKAAVQDLFSRLSDITTWPKDAEVRESTSLTGTDKTSWRKITKGLGNAKESVVNWKKYNDLEMKIFSRWLGRDRAEGSKVLLETEIASARYADRFIGDEEMAELTSRLTMKPSKSTITNIRKAFDVIKEQGSISWPAPVWLGGRWSEFEAKRTSAGEASNIAKARTGLLEWVQSQKTPPDLVDVITQAQHQVVAQRGTPEETEPKPPKGEPQTKTEFVNELRRLNAIDPEEARRYYEKYLDKFW